MKNQMPQRRHHDDDYWDRVMIEVATGATFQAFIRPRFKTSGLSGNEWRVSAIVEVRRHPLAEPVATRSFHRMKSVLEFAPYFVYTKESRLLSSPSPAKITVFRKGCVLMTEERPTFGDAIIGLGWHIITANEGRDGVKWNHLTHGQERAHCQQVGCADLPSVTYRFKKLQLAPSESVMIVPEYDFTGQYTWYCAKHAERGNAGLEDNDENLETMPFVAEA